MRNNDWLEAKLNTIWDKSFSDINRKNTIFIIFGRNARTRLGSIRAKRDTWTGKHQDTQIIVTGFFKDERVPEFIIDVTIAHELCHYAHGFFSPLPQLSKYPHQGGIVERELKRRGFANDLDKQHQWLKQNWSGITGNRRRRSRKGRRIGLLECLLNLS